MYDCYHYVVNKDEYINNLAAVNTTTDRQTDKQTNKKDVTYMYSFDQHFTFRIGSVCTTNRTQIPFSELKYLRRNSFYV